MDGGPPLLSHKLGENVRKKATHRRNSSGGKLPNKKKNAQIIYGAEPRQKTQIITGRTSFSWLFPHRHYMYCHYSNTRKMLCQWDNKNFFVKILLFFRVFWAISPKKRRRFRIKRPINTIFCERKNRPPQNVAEWAEMALHGGREAEIIESFVLPAG